jgi:hypothetical protein
MWQSSNIWEQHWRIKIRPSVIEGGRGQPTKGCKSSQTAPVAEDEPSGPIKDGEFIDQLSDYKLLKMDSAHGVSYGVCDTANRLPRLQCITSTLKF